MDCSQPGFSVHGISQARIPEWVAISFSRGSSLSAIVGLQISQPDLLREASCFIRHDPLSFLLLSGPEVWVLSGFESQMAHLLLSVSCLWRDQDALRCQSSGDHFSNFHVSCHFFHSGRIILKSNLPRKSVVTPNMHPKPDTWAGWLAHPLYNLRFPD